MSGVQSRLQLAHRVNSAHFWALSKHSPSFLYLERGAEIDFDRRGPVSLDAIVWVFAQFQNPPTQVTGQPDSHAALPAVKLENPATLGNGFDCIKTEIVGAVRKIALEFHFYGREK